MTQYIKITKNDELSHVGVLGMHWGKRTSRTFKESELSARKKSKISAKYKKEMVKVEQDVYNNTNNMHLKAWNKTADEYNNAKLTAFNKKHNPNSKGYEEAYNTQVSRDMAKNFDKVRLEHIEKNTNYVKAQALIKKYDMLNYDDLAKKNTDFINVVKEQLKGA